jgi:hypothetical protein
MPRMAGVVPVGVSFQVPVDPSGVLVFHSLPGMEALCPFLTSPTSSMAVTMALSCLQSTLTFNLSKTDQERSCQALHLPSLLFHSSAHSLTHPLTNPLTYQGLPPAHLPVLHSQGCSLLSSYTVCHGQRLAGCLGRELLWKYDNGVGLILHSGITDEGNCPLQALLG